MIFHHTGSMDTYITNKIVNNTSRATGANVGYASTMDLFKLYGESQIAGVAGICTIGGLDYLDKTEVECTLRLGGTWNPNHTELSRGLIRFDLDTLKSEIESKVDILNDSSLSIKLVLKDVQGTQVAPAAFELELLPLTVAFEEGIGDNITTFGDNFSANWLSPSTGATWTENGGGSDVGSRIAVQTITSGVEDLEMDITNWVKSYWNTSDTTVTENLGWMLKFVDSYETDEKTYFVKRFSTRHARNPLLRPKIVVSWESFHIDDHLDFYSSTENNLSIRNFSQSTAASTTNPHKVTLSRGTWSKEAVASEISIAGITQTGHYSAAITVDPYGVDSDLQTDLVASGSLLLQERWTYEDASANTVLIHSGSVDMKYPLASASGLPKEYRFSNLDLKS